MTLIGPDPDMQPPSPFPGRGNAPFTWGRGGRRMTPEEVAFEQQMAERQLADGADYSPVGHWTQGLARVAEGLMGGLRLKGARKANEANRAESQSVLQALLNPPSGTPSMSPGAEVPTPGGNPQAGGINPAIIAALSNQYIDDNTRKLAMQQYQAATKRAEPLEINGQLVDPTSRQVLGDYRTAPQPSEFERRVLAAGFVPGTPAYTALMQQSVNNDVNPLQAVPGFDDQGNQILRFLRPSEMSQGGGGAAPAEPLDDLPPGYTVRPKGGPTPSASGGFSR